MKYFHAIIVAALAACDSNQSGNVGATKVGDMTNAVERSSPLTELREACGRGAPTVAGSVIQRDPYLQQVTTSSAMVGWVTTSPAEEHIVVTTSAGAEVTTAEGIEQRSAQRSAGETQMWATLIGLEPDTIYCYALANGSPMTERIGMRTAPLASSTKPVRFLAFGDSGGGGNDQYADDGESGPESAHERPP